MNVKLIIKYLLLQCKVRESCVSATPDFFLLTLDKMNGVFFFLLLLWKEGERKGRRIKTGLKILEGDLDD